MKKLRKKKHRNRYDRNSQRNNKNKVTTSNKESSQFRISVDLIRVLSVALFPIVNY